MICGGAALNAFFCSKSLDAHCWSHVAWLRNWVCQSELSASTETNIADFVFLLQAAPTEPTTAVLTTNLTKHMYKYVSVYSLAVNLVTQHLSVPNLVAFLSLKSIPTNEI
ncbi:hypothetical protein VNO77_25539 [Canavalia gladiata]|uniref:Uncharacterized protein n=1 Tax=Canavalia gladiata TaxID=3824 RepID=A0AAN9L8A7_CANGL